MDGYTPVIEWVGVILAFIFGVTMFCQGHAIFHGKYGYRHTEREKKKSQDTRKQIEDLLKDKWSDIISTERTGIHPCSRLREKKESESNPRERGMGTPLGPSELFCRISLTHYLRGVAQFGRALALGASGRRFESFHPDLHTYYNYALLFCGILARELGNFDGQSRERRDNRCRERERR